MLCPDWKESPGWDTAFGTWFGALHEILVEMGATSKQMEMVFRTNALRVYGIKHADLVVA